MFRIVRGSVRDFPLRNNLHREGWWWHSAGSPEGYDHGYAPEGPFISKVHARRHLWNTQRVCTGLRSAPVDGPPCPVMRGGVPDGEEGVASPR